MTIRLQAHPQHTQAAQQAAWMASGVPLQPPTWALPGMGTLRSLLCPEASPLSGWSWLASLPLCSCRWSRTQDPAPVLAGDQLGEAESESCCGGSRGERHHVAGSVARGLSSPGPRVKGCGLLEHRGLTGLDREERVDSHSGPAANGDRARTARESCHPKSAENTGQLSPTGREAGPASLPQSPQGCSKSRVA